MTDDPDKSPEQDGPRRTPDSVHAADRVHTLSASELQRLGISPGLARFSVGIELPEQLIQELERALGS